MLNIQVFRIGHRLFLLMIFIMSCPALASATEAVAGAASQLGQVSDPGGTTAWALSFAQPQLAGGGRSRIAYGGGAVGGRGDWRHLIGRW